MVSMTHATIGYADCEAEEQWLICQGCNIIIRTDILSGENSPINPPALLEMFNSVTQTFPPYVIPPTNNYNPVNSDFTVETLVKITTLSTIQCLASCRDLDGKGWELMVSTDGSVFIQGTGSFVQTPVGVVQVGIPVHCRVTRKGGIAQIHINGTLRAKGSLTTSSSTVQMVIGRKAIGGYQFTGQLSGLSYWDQALTYSGDTIGVNYFTPVQWPV